MAGSSSTREMIEIAIMAVRIIGIAFFLTILAVYLVKVIGIKKKIKEAQDSNNEELIKESQQKLDSIHQKRNIFLIVIICLFVLGPVCLKLFGPVSQQYKVEDYMVPINVVSNTEK